MRDDQLVAYNVLSVFAWGALTWVILRGSGRSHEYTSRWVSLIHAIISCAACSYALVLYYPDSGMCTVAKDWELLALVITNGYFIMDGIGMCFAPFYDTIFMLHHIVSVIGFGLPMVVRSNAYETVLAIWILEISNPALHLHWILVEDHPGGPHRKLLVFSRRSFYFMFFVARGFFGCWLVYSLWVAPCAYTAHAFIGSCFVVFSAQFFWELMGKLRRSEDWR